MPTWGTYLIFAIATIVLGAILGLVSTQIAKSLNGIAWKMSEILSFCF